MPCFNNGSAGNGGSSYECSVELKRLYDIYMKLTSGRAISEQQDAEYRRVKFAQGDPEKILELYGMYWDQCGAESGLPDLRKAGRIEQKAIRFRG
ncbi:hypothetical protein [Roseibium alexandrii]|uniref:Uncharacterized protein n=1 Tax=Roseibium alexandrii (strain DSM 17067 / NCIMB 14079 / DFL-11) TaxID=244592 RepID=A0A5E8GW93_ROSAD|nr:hypothetical protein [Roseibium alexandrii]EEE44230.1 hypothetical protein SADFL11_1517 [Roseibium alexandrii DFL-11]